MTEQERILQYAEEQFLQHGFYKVSMDEVAADLRISKKTIYKHFASKEQLVHDMAMAFIGRHRASIGQIVAQNKPALEKLMDMFLYLSNVIVKMSPAWLHDINTLMPQLWIELDQYRSVVLRENLDRIITQGKAEGVFTDYPGDMMIEIFTAAVSRIINPAYLTTHHRSYIESARLVIMLLVHGILTDAGRQQFSILQSGATL